jgi:2-C-methyl-D-erythritol 4-phosphate cytidylyltransferase
MSHSDSQPLSVATQAPPQLQTPPAKCVAVILVAAGRGSRFGSAENKVLLPLAGRPIWIRAVEALQSSIFVASIVLVVRDCDRGELEPIANSIGVSVVEGGKERYDSVHSGLKWLARTNDASPLVAVHDAARPLVSTADIDAVITSAFNTQAAILATPVRGTIKRSAGTSTSTVSRENLWEALTPQVFATPILRAAYDRHRGRPATDDAELVERLGTAVCLVPGSAENIKITQAEDLQIAEAIFSRRITTHV